MEKLRVDKGTFDLSAKLSLKQLRTPFHTKSISTVTTTSDFYKSRTTRGDDSPKLVPPAKRASTELDDSYDKLGSSPVARKTEQNEEEKNNKKIFFKIKKAIIRSSINSKTKGHGIKVEKISEVITRPPTTVNNVRSSQGTLSTSPQTFRRRGILDEYNQSKKLNTIVKILKLKGNIYKTLKLADMDKTLEILLDMININLTEGNISMLLESIKIVGDIYLMFGEIKNAINTFHNMKAISEYSDNDEKKILSFIGLSDCCKRTKWFNYSIKFLKKALQYAWFRRLEFMEQKIYEELGIVYFHMGLMNKAIYFHERSLGKFRDDTNELLKKLSFDTIVRFKRENPPKATFLSKFFFEKHNFLPFHLIRKDGGSVSNFRDRASIKNISEFSPDNDKPNLTENLEWNIKLDLQCPDCEYELVPNSHRFCSTLEENLQIDLILGSEEFETEINTPYNETVIKNEEEVIQLEKRKAESDSKTAYSKKINESLQQMKLKKLQKRSKFFSDKLRNQQQNSTMADFRLTNNEPKKREMGLQMGQKVHLNLKKTSLEEQLERRLRLGFLFEKGNYINEFNKFMTHKVTKDKLNKVVKLHHLTPNRNIEEFKYGFNLNYSKAFNFFDASISKEYKQIEKQTNY